MISQVLKATQENPLKNDFVFTCKKYMKILGIEFSFEEIEKMSKASFKKVVKEKTKQAAYKYLIGQKSKQSKISDIKYSKLEMQSYLAEGDRDARLSKLIFKARGRTLDIKMDKKWKSVCYFQSQQDGLAQHGPILSSVLALLSRQS